MLRNKVFFLSVLCCPHKNKEDGQEKKKKNTCTSKHQPIKLNFYILLAQISDLCLFLSRFNYGHFSDSSACITFAPRCYFCADMVNIYF